MSERRIILLLFIFIFLINESKNDIDFNNIISINEYELENLFFFLQMKNKNFLFLFPGSDSNEDIYMVIYELKSTDGTNRIITIPSPNYEINIELNDYYLTSSEIMIDNKNYPFMCGTKKCFLLDLENNIMNFIDLYLLFQEEEEIFFNGVKYNYVHIINIDNKNKVLLTFFPKTDLYLSIVKINNKDLSFQPVSLKKEAMKIPHDISCFVTSNNYIECLYINKIDDINYYYYVAIYDDSFNNKNEILLDSDPINFGPKKPFINSIKSIHLRNEIGVFAYYINDSGGDFSKLRMQINELYFDEDIPKFKEVISEKIK